MTAPASEQSVFLNAIALESPADRAAYLDEACRGDSVLRAEVDALLAAHDRLAAGAPTVAAGGPAPTVTFDPAAPGAGAVVGGRYKLLERVGEGGMGEVWMADQTEPVKRRVAVKLIKAGMDSKQVLARFEAERQALALMDHPNIARVLDGGAHDGRPFFVMELVKGSPITRYCDDQKLSVRDRLSLFADVCRAVQHAHQKGVIHRDLKPSNVLVAPFDGRPVVKVIDFGVAKATGPALTDKTLFTGFGGVVGTPEYMSPEQAELNNQDVDTRTDVYSLGVLLYELLTGTTPLTRRRVKEAALLEVLRVIREEDPPRPSTRLSTLAELPSVAACRGVEPRRLSGQVRGELDWIVMKALEKDRNRRYDSPNGLAHDLDRYLTGEAVLACPPSAWYRARKFARRHRVGMGVAGLTLAVLVVLGSGGGWVVRDRAARRAQTADAVAADLREAQTFQDRGRLPEALAAARQASRLADAGGDAGLQDLARRRVDDLAMAAEVEAIRLRRTEVIDGGYDHDRAVADYARAFRAFGFDLEALAPAEAGRALGTRSVRTELAAALDDWALLLRFRQRDSWRDRVAVARAIDPDPLRDRVRAAVAGGDRAELDRLAEADEVADLPAPTLVLLFRTYERDEGLRRTEALLRAAQRKRPGDFWINCELGFFLSQVSPSPDAVRFHAAAAAARPDAPSVRANLAGALRAAGRLEDAVAEAREAVRLKPDYPVAHNNLASALYALRRFDEAILAGAEAIRLKPDYAEAYNNRGIALKARGRVPEAVKDLEEAVRHKNDFPTARNNLGTALMAAGRTKEAVPHLREAIRLRTDYLNARLNLAAALLELNESEESLKTAREAVRLNPESAEAFDCLGRVLERTGGSPDEAVAAYRRATVLQPRSANAHFNLAGALRARGLPAEALVEYKEAAELAPDDPRTRLGLGLGYAANGLHDDAIREFGALIREKDDFLDAHLLLARSLAAKGQFGEAAAEREKALKLAPKNVRALNDMAWMLATCPDPRFRDPARAAELAGRAIALQRTFGSAWNTLGIARYRAGDFKAALDALNQSVRLQRGGDANDWFFLAMAHAKLNDLEAARTWFDKAVAGMATARTRNDDLDRFRAEAEQVLDIMN